MGDDVPVYGTSQSKAFCVGSSMMHLPMRSFFLALIFVLLSAIPSKVPAAENWRTHYQGDYSRRPLDGSRRYEPDAEWSSSSQYRSTQPPPAHALAYDGVPLLAPIWTGIYGGLHGGGGWGTSTLRWGQFGGDVDLSGALEGAHIGYLLRSGALVAGLEFDADLSQINHTTNIGNFASLMADVDWLVSARARLGVLAGPALFYATGGVAVIGTSSRLEFLGFNASTSDTKTALVLGGGIEIGLNEKMAVRLEALHYFMDDEKYALPEGLGSIKASGSLTTVRAGLTFFLN